MFYSTEYFQIINTLSDLSGSFNSKHDTMVQSMPLKYVDHYLRDGFIHYCSRVDYRFDTAEFYEDKVLCRKISIDTQNGKFLIMVVKLDNENLLSLESSNNKKKALNKIKIAEICYKIDSEGYISAYLEKTDNGYVLLFEEYAQDKENCNKYDLVNTEKYELSEQQVLELFSIEMVNNPQADI